MLWSRRTVVTSAWNPAAAAARPSGYGYRLEVTSTGQARGPAEWTRGKVLVTRIKIIYALQPDPKNVYGPPRRAAYNAKVLMTF